MLITEDLKIIFGHVNQASQNRPTEAAKTRTSDAPDLYTIHMNVPLLPVQTAGAFLQRVSLAASPGISFTRANKYIADGNQKMFHPCNLEAKLMGTKKMMAASRSVYTHGFKRKFESAPSSGAQR
jgi:hypothetical protein